MRSNEEIEAFLLQLSSDFQTVGEGMWLIHDQYDHLENLVIYNDAPVVTFRCKLMDLPTGPRRAEFCEKLLRLNATEMVAGAYGIEDESVVIVDSLQSENLDLNELQASIDGLSLAISVHYSELNQYRESSTEVASGALSEFDARLDDSGN
jgi:hypothetical protein